MASPSAAKAVAPAWRTDSIVVSVASDVSEEEDSESEQSERSDGTSSSASASDSSTSRNEIDDNLDIGVNIDIANLEEVEEESWSHDAGPPRDSLAFVPIGLSACAATTCVVTVVWGCTNPRVECTFFWPSVSTAAQYHPQRHVFTIGMFLCGLLWLVTLGLVCWHARLALSQADKHNRIITSSILVAGLGVGAGIMSLVFIDNKSYPQGHTIGVVLLFLFLAIVVAGICLCRRRLEALRPSRHLVARHHGEGLATAFALSLASRTSGSKSST